MTQASRNWQLVAKEGWLKAGAKTSTQQPSEGIILHMGETPSWWLVSPFRLGVSPLLVHLRAPLLPWSDVHKTLRLVSHPSWVDGVVPLGADSLALQVQEAHLGIRH